VHLVREYHHSTLNSICLIVSSILLLSGCGGGGSNVIPPFWMQSGIVVADLDGNGLDDVAVATTYIAGPPPHPGYVQVYLQTSAGIFGAPVRYPVAADPWGMSAGDIDGDGLLDFVVATPRTVIPQINVINDSGGISILRQDRSNHGHFLDSQWIFTGGSATDAAIAKLDQDSFADLIVADGVLVNGRAMLYLQDPALPGEFLPPSYLLSGKGSEDIDVADVNGDNRDDIVLAANDCVVVFYQLAGGGFGSPSLLSAGLAPQGVAIGDLDGNGLVDIVAANAGNAPAGGTGGASVTILLQTSSGVFVPTEIPVANGARRLAIGDLNGDSFPDIAVVSLVYQDLNTPSQVSVLLQSNVNRGHFTVTGVYNGTFSGNFIAIGDVNGDNRNDIILNDGPGVLIQRATPAGNFEAIRPLR
jgi:hypothetical protein